jgi:TetR/AcrR family transcriptional regulator
MPKKNRDIGAEEKILVAARKVFIAKGMSGARMQDIADEAGINKALLHYYFRTKEQLFETIFKEVMGNLVPRIKSILLSDLTLYEKIEQFCDQYIGIISQNPYLPIFILNELHKQPSLMITKMFGGELPDLHKFTAQVEKEVKAGKIKPISPVHLIMNMMSLCVFPFLGKPLLSTILGMDALQFQLAMEQRKKAIPQFIFDAIRK